MTAFGGWVLEGWSRLNLLAQGAAEGMAAGGWPMAQEFPFWQHFIRVALVLSAMLGVLVLVLYLWKRSGVLRPQGVSPLIQVLATHYMAPKKALILVAVGRERLLLASAGDRLSLVAPLAPATAAQAEEPTLVLPLKSEKEGGG